MTPYRNPVTGAFRLVDSSNPADVADAVALGFVVYVHPPDSLMPPPYAKGLVIYNWQVGNWNPPDKPYNGL